MEMKKKCAKIVTVLLVMLLIVSPLSAGNVMADPVAGMVASSPLSGFTRYDDTANSGDFVFQNMSGWTNSYGDDYDFINANMHHPIDTTTNSSVSFYIQGTQFYLVCQCYEGGNGRNRDLDIYIDGQKTHFSAPQRRIDGHAIYYVSPVLTSGTHSVTLVSTVGISGDFAFDGVDVNGTILSSVPTVGSGVNVPISGFTRYDDTANSNDFIYQNMSSWTSSSGDNYNFINANMHHPIDTTENSSVSFYIQGTQFYLICQCYDGGNGRNKDLDIYIDGQKTHFSAPQKRIDGHVIYYISPVLTNGVHSIVLVSTVGVSGDFAFDGVDVNGTIPTSAPTVSSSVNSAAPGFTRYDDTANSNLFVYNNMCGWSNGNTGNFLNGNVHVRDNDTQNASVSFSMQGSQFYLFVQLCGGRNSAIDVYIDGVLIQTYTAPQSLNNGHKVYYVSPVLLNGFHTVMLVYNPGASGGPMFDGVDVNGTILDPSTTPVVGAVVNTPKSGFTRYDDTANSASFIYNNMYYWSNGDTGSFWNGNVHSPTDKTKDASVSFTIQGTQFYTLVQCVGTRNEDIDVYIDGQYSLTFTAPQFELDGHVVGYISPVLSSGVHSVRLKFNGNHGQMIFDGLDVKGTLVAPAMAPSVGDVVNSSMTGFTRYDDVSNSNLFVFSNLKMHDNGDTGNFINGNYHQTADGTQDASVSFTMQGTQFYLICQCTDGARNKDVNVYIDGSYTETFTAPQCLVNGHIAYYTSPVLFSGYHSVTLKCNENDGLLFFDGIDVKGALTTPDTTPPSVPTDLCCASKTDTSITLSWTVCRDNVDVTGYRIYRDGVLVATTRSNGFTDTGLQSGHSYSYTVSAFDAFNNTSEKSDVLNFNTSVPSFASANDMEEMHLATGTINSSTASELYSVEKASGDYLEVFIVDPIVSGKALQYTVTIYGPDQSCINAIKSTNGQDYIRCKVNTAGTYYIRVSGDADNYDAQTPYTLTVQ